MLVLNKQSQGTQSASCHAVKDIQQQHKHIPSFLSFFCVRILGRNEVKTLTTANQTQPSSFGVTPFCFLQTLSSSLTENTITAPKIEWLIRNRCCSTIRSQLNSRTPDPPESPPLTSSAASLFLYPIPSLFLSFAF